MAKSTKVFQLTGTEDRASPGTPTGAVRSGVTGGITGTDLGFPFEYNGKLYFLFGDSREFPPDLCEPEWCGTELNPVDVLQPNPERVLRWRSEDEWQSFVQAHGDGHDSMATAPLEFEPDHGFPVSFETWETGLVFGHEITGDGIGASFRCSGPRVAANPQDRHVLVMGDRILVVTKDGSVFAHEISGNTIGVPFQLGGPKAAANPQDKWVLVMGNRILVVTRQHWHYYAGQNANGQPLWKEEEAYAVPIPPFGSPQFGKGYHECLGYFSVRRIEAWGKWVMLYACNNDESAGYNRENGPRGIYLRTAEMPWGPWSPPQQIFDPKDGYCHFMHNQRADECNERDNRGVNPAEESVRDIDQAWYAGKPTKRGWGGEYAPILLPSRYAKLQEDQVTLYYLMSTWNPYQVVLMRTQVPAVM